MIRFAALALLAATGSQRDTPDLGTLGEPARAAVASFATLAIADADDRGTLRWAAWGKGRGEGQSAHLALFGVGDGAATPRWAINWPDGYLPRLHADTRWTYGGRPVVAVVVQYGAGAVEVLAFGLATGDQPRQLFAAEGVAADWRRDANGAAVLVLFQRSRTGSASRAFCHGWQPAKATLVPIACPR